MRKTLRLKANVQLALRCLQIAAFILCFSVNDASSVVALIIWVAIQASIFFGVEAVLELWGTVEDPWLLRIED